MLLSRRREVSIERRLAAILAADVVGYSRLIRADEEGTTSALNATRADLIDPKIAEHHGCIVNRISPGELVKIVTELRGSQTDDVANTLVQSACATG